MEREERVDELVRVEECQNVGEKRRDIVGGGVVENTSNLARVLLFGAIGLIGGAGLAGCGARSGLSVDDPEIMDVRDGGGGNGGGGLDAGVDASVNLECNKVNIAFEGPGSETVLSGATNQPVFCFKVKNGCVAGEIDQLTFETEGASNPGHLEFTLADVDGARFSDFQTGSQDSFSHTFTDLKYKLSADSESEICLYVNVLPMATANETFDFRFVPKIESFSNGATFEGVPESIAGNLYLVAAPFVDAVSVEAVDSLPALFSGEHGKVAALKIMQPASVEDAELTRLSLRFGGTCDPQYIQNMKLYAEGGNTPICSAKAPDGFHGMAHLKCSPPYFIQKGTTSNFYVTADQACPVGTNIEAFLDHPSDLFMKGMTFGNGEGVKGFDGQNGVGSFSTVNIN